MDYFLGNTKNALSLDFVVLVAKQYWRGIPLVPNANLGRGTAATKTAFRGPRIQSNGSLCDVTSTPVLWHMNCCPGPTMACTISLPNLAPCDGEARIGHQSVDARINSAWCSTDHHVVCQLLRNRVMQASCTRRCSGLSTHHLGQKFFG